MPDFCTVAVVMPALNEERGIADFIGEIEDCFPSQTEVIFVVVDDASSDQTASVAVENPEIDVRVTSNPRNLGHGPSMTKALNLGLDVGADYIVSTDGDGQFSGADIVKLVLVAEETGSDIVEGVRVRTKDPFFRRATSLATRALVAMRTHSWPTDANTPTRAYRSDTLKHILKSIPPRSAIPNLHISVATRNLGLSSSEVPVVVRERLGGDPAGTSWGGTRHYLPSRRFLNFCVDAAKEWLLNRKPSSLD